MGWTKENSIEAMPNYTYNPYPIGLKWYFLRIALSILVSASTAQKILTDQYLSSVFDSLFGTTGILHLTPVISKLIISTRIHTN